MALDPTQVIEMLLSAVNKQTSSYQQQAEEYRKLYNSGAGSDRARKQVELEDEVKARKKVIESLEDFRKLSKKFGEESKDGASASKETTEEIVKARDSLIKQGIVSKTQASKIGQQQEEMLLERTKLAAKEYKTAVDKMEQEDKSVRRLEKFSENVKSAGKAIFNWKTALAAVTTGVVRSFDEVEVAMKHQVGMYSLFSADIGAAISSLDLNKLQSAAGLGLSPKEMQELVIRHRQMILSSGSVGEMFNALGEHKQAAYELTGSYEAGAAVQLETMSQIKKLGINESFAGMSSEVDKTIGSLTILSKRTGMASTELLGLWDQYQDQADVQKQLFKLNKQERMVRRNNFFELIKFGTTIGKSAQEMVKLQEAIVEVQSMSGVDRLEAGAITGAIMSSFGVKGGAEFAQLMKKPKLTDEEKKRMQELGDSIYRQNQAMRSLGGYAEQQADALMNTIPGSVRKMIEEAHTMGSEGQALTKDQTDRIDSQQSQLQNSETYLRDIRDIVKKLEPVFTGPAASILGGAFSLLGNIMWEGFKMLVAGRIISSMAGGGSLMSAAGSVVGGAGASKMMGKMGKGALSMGKGVGIGGGIALAGNLAGSAIGGRGGDYLSSAASGAGMGAMMGSVVPIIGTAVGAGIGALAGLGYEAFSAPGQQSSANVDESRMLQSTESLGVVTQSLSELQNVAYYTNDISNAMKNLNVMFKEHKDFVAGMSIEEFRLRKNQMTQENLNNMTPANFREEARK